MSDLAVERRMLIDDTRKDSDGNKIFRVLPWQIVTYDNTGINNSPISGLEPVSVNVSGVVVDNRTDLEITGIDFIEEGTLFSQTNTGGEPMLPIA